MGKHCEFWDNEKDLSAESGGCLFIFKQLCSVTRIVVVAVAIRRKQPFPKNLKMRVRNSNIFKFSPVSEYLVLI